MARSVKLEARWTSSSSYLFAGLVLLLAAYLAWQAGLDVDALERAAMRPLRRSEALTGVGGVLGLVAIGLSYASWRISAERARIQADRRFQATFEQAAVGIAHVAPDGRLLRVNDRFCEIVDLSRGQLLSGDFQGITHPDDLDIDLAHVQGLLSGAADRYSLEKRYIRGSGELVWVHLTVALIRDPIGAPDYFVSVVEDISDRKATEARLREERDRSTGYLSVAGVMLLVLDAEGRIETINRKGAEILGYDDPSELVGRDWCDLALPEHERAGVRAVRAKLMAGELVGADAYENSILRTDGTPRLIAWRNTVLRSADGEIVGTLSSGEDVTEQRMAEAELRRINTRFAVAQANARFGIWEHDFTTGAMHWDALARELYGIMPGATIDDATWKARVHPDDLGEIEQAVAEAIERRAPLIGEHRVVLPDGQIRWLSVLGRPQVSEDGRVEKAVGVFFDVTSSKIAEAALRESEARFRELANAMPIVVWTARPDGFLDYYNDHWYTYTGMPRGGGGDPSWEPILHPDDLQRCLDVWYEAVRTGEPYEIEYRFKRVSDGAYRWHLGRALPVRDASGAVVKWYGTGTDIHDLKEAQSDLGAALEAKELLLYEVNHRVKNSLQMVTSLMLIEAGKLRDPGARAAVMGARQKVSTIAQLHRRLYVGGLHAEVDFTAFVRDLAAEIVQSSGRADEIGIVVQDTAVVLPIKVAGPLSLIASELVTNAVKYAFPDRSGRLEIDVKASAYRVAIEISDNGVGLPLGFEPARATSVGMKIVLGLAQQVGGRFEHVATPSGARFRVTAPLRRAR